MKRDLSKLATASDSELFSQIRKGDQRAFRCLFDRYYTPLCRFAYTYLDSKEIVEDIVIELLAVVWSQREEIVIHSNVKSYLFQALRNRAFNQIRATQYTVSIDGDALQLPDGNQTHDLEMTELNQLIEDVIMTLPHRCKEVFECSRRDGMPNAEIASSLGISVKAVEAQITKALKKIKVHLNAHSYLLLLL